MRFFTLTALIVVAGASGGCERGVSASAGSVPPARQLVSERLPAAGSPQQIAVERGRYIVDTVACHDCHTPKVLTPTGPEFDFSRRLSGHAASEQLPSPPVLAKGPWMAVTSWDLTAWSGPWGVSYAVNLTPDPETGLGNWTEEMFVKALQTGKHMGASRPILPPMPWQVYGKMTTDDLKAMFAYLRTVPAIKNRVPDPVFASTH